MIKIGKFTLVTKGPKILINHFTILTNTQSTFYALNLTFCLLLVDFYRKYLLDFSLRKENMQFVKILTPLCWWSKQKCHVYGYLFGRWRTYKSKHNAKMINILMHYWHIWLAVSDLKTLLKLNWSSGMNKKNVNLKKKIFSHKSQFVSNFVCFIMTLNEKKKISTSTNWFYLRSDNQRPFNRALYVLQTYLRISR